MSSIDKKEQLLNGDGNEAWDKRCVVWPAAATLHDPASSLFFLPCYNIPKVFPTIV